MRKKKIPVIRQQFHQVLKKIGDTNSENNEKKPKKKKIAHKVLIERVHQLNNEKQSLLEKVGIGKQKVQRLKEIEEELNSLGGLFVYQKASQMGERSFNTARYFIRAMGNELISWAKVKKEPLKLLDVGALDLNYTKQSYITATAIDLHPTRAGILKADYLEFPEQEYNIICLSLVINFCGIPEKRGLMLTKSYRMLTSPSDKTQGGLLYIVLPRPCLENSRFINALMFKNLVSRIGFELIHEKNSPKLAFFIFRKTLNETKIEDLKIEDIKYGKNLNTFNVII